jgi:GntR family transcriptional repressor for pyruvate dehydrogenase complex
MERYQVDRETAHDSRFELKLDPGRPLPEAIADKLRELIDGAVLKPGSRLPTESELARSMHVARSSVRTALQRLETLGVLEVKRGLGWYVRRAPNRSPTGAADLLAGKRYALSDLFELRIAMEGLAASLAAVRAGDGEIEDIVKLNKLHHDAGDDRNELLSSDQDFHEAVIRASRNELLISSYKRIADELTDWRYDSYSERGEALRSAREHSKVVRYLRNHDPGGARAAMNSHLQRLYDSLPIIGHEPLDLTDTGSDFEVDWRSREVDG